MAQARLPHDALSQDYLDYGSQSAAGLADFVGPHMGGSLVAARPNYGNYGYIENFSVA